jgi:DNA-binding CsgD family transcriptional regulator/N-acetylneuraminic acid mutarotase
LSLGTESSAGANQSWMAKRGSLRYVSPTSRSLICPDLSCSELEPYFTMPETELYPEIGQTQGSWAVFTGVVVWLRSSIIVTMAEPGEPLSEREREIVRLVATGATNRMIAHQLSISPNTVKVHLRNIFSKLEISSRTEATVTAIREGWVEVIEDQADGVAAIDGTSATTRARPMEAGVPEGLTVLLEPLPRTKRLYLLFSVLAIAAVTALSWPRVSSSSAEVCENEFTADCPAEAGELALDEPESLWVSGAQMPQPRGRFALVSFRRYLYVIGGETSEGVTGSTLVYHPQEDAWSTGADKLTPAANLAAVALEDRIYAIGGGSQQGKPLAALEVYDPETDSWDRAASPPVPLAAHAAAAWGDRVYVFGGWNGASYTGDSFAYDPPSDRWQRLSPMPTARGFAGAAVLNDQIYVVGGYDGQREHKVCELYDPVQDLWASCPSMSTPRGGIGLAAVAGQLYAIGGGWNSFVTFGERYHPRQGAWHAVEIPLLLTGGEWRNMGVAAVGTRVYALGGWQRGRYLDVNQAYETLPNRLYLPATSGQ